MGLGNFIGNRTRAMRRLANPEREEFAQTRRGAMKVIRAGIGILFNPDNSKHLDGKSNDQMMAQWGINDDNRSNVVRGHYIEMAFYGLVILLGFYQFFVGLFGDYSLLVTLSRTIGGGLVLVAGLIRISILVWRVEMIQSDYWVTYSRWIRGGEPE